MNNPANTLSGWAFGSNTPVPLPQTTPSVLPRPQIPVGPPAILRPRILFPASLIRLNSSLPNFAVADPNAPPVANMIAAAATVPAPQADVPPVAAVAVPVQQPLAIAVPSGLTSSQIAHFEAIISYLNQKVASQQHIMNHQVSAKIPMPALISSLAKLVNDPEMLSLLLSRIFEYIVRQGLDWPGDVRLFVTDPGAAKWVQSYLDHAQATAPQEFNQNDFIQAFVAFVTGEVRPRSVIALEEIMGHLITQGTDSAAQYAEFFNQRARILPHISPVVLCHHFILGLKPELKRICCVDREGLDWSSLSSLIAFTLVEERRLNLVSVGPSLPSFSPPVKKRWHPQGEEGWTKQNKKARFAAIRPSASPTPMKVDNSGAGPSSGAYANAVMQPKKATVTKPPSSGVGASGSAPPVQPSVLGPPQACPFYKLNNKGRKLYDFEQKGLTAYGLCWYCKESTSHVARDCPLKH